MDTKKNASLGVVIGRFQVHRLHKGYRRLLHKVASRHESLLVVLSDSGGQRTNRNPLDVATRAAMIRKAYPKAIVRSVMDRTSRAAWSMALDECIAACAEAGGEVILYGSRESFVTSYAGRFKACVLDEIFDEDSASQLAKAVKLPIGSEAFRQGVIYATLNRFPTAYPTVDIAIVRHETGEVLLGRKTGETRWRFPGGFVDPADVSLEAAAKREAFEETSGLDIGDPVYVGSQPIDDVRYRGSADSVMTSIFVVPYLGGSAQAGDDLAEVRWVQFNDVEACIADFHRAIWKRVAHHLHLTSNQG